MSRKDYDMLARLMGETFANWDNVDCRASLLEFRGKLLEELTAANPRFDAARFRMAVQAFEVQARERRAA
jgi:hypothetical protein